MIDCPAKKKGWRDREKKKSVKQSRESILGPETVVTWGEPSWS